MLLKNEKFKMSYDITLLLVRKNIITNYTKIQASHPLTHIFSY